MLALVLLDGGLDCAVVVWPDAPPAGWPLSEAVPATCVTFPLASTVNAKVKTEGCPLTVIMATWHEYSPTVWAGAAQGTCTAENRPLLMNVC